VQVTGLTHVVPPGTTKGWVSPSPAQTPQQLVIRGGFVVDDGRVRRLQQRARQLGFSNLRSYLQAGCDAGYSLPALAGELGESQWTVGQALATQRITCGARQSRFIMLQPRDTRG
jgi:hypothetical protein